VEEKTEKGNQRDDSMSPTQSEVVVFKDGEKRSWATISGPLVAEKSKETSSPSASRRETGLPTPCLQHSEIHFKLTMFRAVIKGTGLW
jgi:hypothetical protein